MSDQLGRKLVRSLNGIRIHRATCKWARPGHVRPWMWPETMTVRGLLAEVEGLGLKPCKECKPLEGL